MSERADRVYDATNEDDYRNQEDIYEEQLQDFEYEIEEAVLKHSELSRVDMIKILEEQINCIKLKNQF